MVDGLGSAVDGDVDTAVVVGIDRTVVEGDVEAEVVVGTTTALRELVQPATTSNTAGDRHSHLKRLIASWDRQ